MEKAIDAVQGSTSNLCQDDRELLQAYPPPADPTTTETTTEQTTTGPSGPTGP